MRRAVLAGLAMTGAALLVLIGLGVYYRQRWSWLVVPTWMTALATLGLFAGAVVTAFCAQRALAGQAEELREQRAFNRSQTEFNDRQLEILHNQQVLAQEAERRERTPRFRADVLTRNDGSVSMYLHLRLLSEYPLSRIDVKLLDRIDGFPVDCPIGFTPGQWGVPRWAADGSSAWDGPQRYRKAGLRDRAWWPAEPGVDTDVGLKRAPVWTSVGQLSGDSSVFPRWTGRPSRIYVWSALLMAMRSGRSPLISTSPLTTDLPTHRWRQGTCGRAR